MGKHAYLIIAHDKWEQLQFLISLLNDPRNDFFLLVDAKAKGFDREAFKEKCATKQIYFVNPLRIYWGDFTQILAELALLKTATGMGEYSYYHLISAVDMPLKSQDELHEFFKANEGMEFVDYDSYDDPTMESERIRYHYYLQKLIGRRRKDLLKIGRDLFIVLEKLFGVNRIKEIEQYVGKGANWFSITDNLARYIVNNEAFIHDHFKRTYCADEIFVQTMLKMSPFRDNWYGFKNKDIAYQNLRYCDWGRGKPYTFKKEEYYDLCSKEEYLFARKFDADIVSNEVREYLLNRH